MFVPLHPTPISPIPSLLFEQTQDTALMSCLFLLSDKNHTEPDGKRVIKLYNNYASLADLRPDLATLSQMTDVLAPGCKKCLLKLLWEYDITRDRNVPRDVILSTDISLILHMILSQVLNRCLFCIGFISQLSSH